MDISIGRTVHYKMEQQDCSLLQQMRQTMEAEFSMPKQITGTEDVREGEVFPALIVKALGSNKASLQVAVPGFPGTLYLPNKVQGSGEGQWLWPELSEAGPYRDQLPTMIQQQQGSRQTQNA